MSSKHYTDARCAHCAKSLLVANGELQAWRAPGGQFFCNEFCADDAEEARFNSYRRYSKPGELRAP
jgi:hypothetical protein